MSGTSRLFALLVVLLLASGAVGQDDETCWDRCRASGKSWLGCTGMKIVGTICERFPPDGPLDTAAIAPPPPPPSACNNPPFVVFFDWNSAALGQEAAAMLEAVLAARNCANKGRIHLAGHTDTTGSQSFNLGLSERRNAAVAAFLANKGANMTAVDSQAFGETQLRVPTADEVRELQNRRVEIVVE